MSSNAIEETRAKLEELQAAERAEQRRLLIERLQVAREDLHTAEMRYPEIVSAFKVQQQARNDAQVQVNRDKTAIDESLQDRPRVAAFLPDDREVVRWQKQHDALIAKRARHIRERDELPDPESLHEEGAAYEGDLGIIAQLRRAVANLCDQIDRLDGKGTQSGSISAVNWQV
jgi:hypothetical protein